MEPSDIKMTMPEGVDAGDDHSADTGESESAPQFTEAETEAMALGWKPESEFTPKPGRKWKTAERFLEDKPLYDKIDEQHKTAKRLEKQVDLMRQHYEKVEKAAFERALETLKAERKQALEEGDLVRAEEIRDEIQERKESAPRPTVAQPDPDVQANLSSWKTRNDWYEKDEDMTAFADGLGNKLLTKGKTATEILEIVETKVQAAFPHKFRNPNRDSAPRVEGGSNKKGSGTADTGLTAQETRIMENLIKSGAPITRDEYIRDLKKAKGIR